MAGEVGREHVELRAALGRHLLGDLPPALVARLAGLLLELVDARPLHLDDVAQLLGDVVVDAAEVVALELVAAAPAEPLEQLADALRGARRSGRGSPTGACGAGRR